MLLGQDVRVCIAHSETDNEVENTVKDALETIKSLQLARSPVLHESMPEVGKTVDGHCGTQ